MADSNQEPDGKVYTSLDGQRFATIKSSFGSMRVVDSPAIKQVDVCLLEGKLKRDCLMTISYSKDAGPGVIPGLKVNDSPLIDMDAIGPKLAETLVKALSGVSVAPADAEAIGRLTTEIGEKATRQRGVRIP